MKVFEAFSGIGTQSIALSRAGIEHEVVGVAEIDVNAIISYATMRGHDIEICPNKTYEEMYDTLASKRVGYNYKTKKIVLPKNFEDMERLYVADKAIKNYGDVALINPDELPDFDFFTYSFPCQDLSISGKSTGLRGERSGQLYECEKIILTKRPKILMLENVKNLVGKKHKADFDSWLEWLALSKYTSKWKIMNSKDFGVAQNRERVFAMSILGDTDFEFPEGFPLTARLKHYLEPFECIEEKHYLEYDFTPSEHTGECLQVGTINCKGHDQIKRVYSIEGIAPTIPTCQGGNQHPKILVERPLLRFAEDGGLEVRQATKKGYEVAYEGDSINLEQPKSKTRRGRVGFGVAQTLNTAPLQYTLQNKVVRRLTPKECWRLMGVPDGMYDGAAKYMSDSQLYKQAGNAIVVDVMIHIFKALFK